MPTYYDTNELKQLISTSKGDFEKAKQVIALGYPAVAPILPQLLEWLHDYNWPVAKPLAPFLASIGTPLLPHIKYILDSDDLIWKYWMFSLIVAESPELSALLRPELKHFAHSPTRSEISEELHIIAQEILAKYPE